MSKPDVHSPELLSESKCPPPYQEHSPNSSETETCRQRAHSMQRVIHSRAAAPHSAWLKPAEGDRSRSRAEGGRSSSSRSWKEPRPGRCAEPRAAHSPSSKGVAPQWPGRGAPLRRRSILQASDLSEKVPAPQVSPLCRASPRATKSNVADARWLRTSHARQTWCSGGMPASGAASLGATRTHRCVPFARARPRRHRSASPPPPEKCPRRAQPLAR